VIKWDSVVDALDVGIIIVDEQNKIVAWNPWIETATTLSATSVIGRDLFDLFESLRETRIPSAVSDAFQFGSSTVLNHSLNKLFALSRENGKAIVHNVIVRPLSGNPVTHCILQIVDVTVSVNRERVLRERQNARYHAIVDTAPEAIITTGTDRTIQWMNGAAEEVFGFAAGELLGHKLEAVLRDHHNFSGLLDAHDSDRAASATSVQVSGLLRTGTLAYFEVSYASWNADDRRFITTIWRNVTERVVAENALRDVREALRRNNEELEERVKERTREHELALGQLHESQKMETIGQLTGGVAHDFNNLLAVILGSLSLLKKGLPSDPRTSRLLDGAIQGAERGATLTKRLLAFARRQELRLEAVEVQKLIPDMQEFLRQSIGPAITIILDIPADIPPVKADANQLELAVMNLAVNARDAMPNGGTLTIACRSVSTEVARIPKTLAHGEYVQLSVVDTGEGMSATTLAKAMEPFFTTKGIGKGTGLGLSMVHGLAAQCGGAINITSKLGRGTTVNLWVPTASAEDIAAVPQQQAPTVNTNEGRKLRILLVDDDFLVRTNTAFMLSDLGHMVVEAPSAKAALDMLQADKDLDLVVTDYVMPGMNGLDLAKEIRKNIPHLPIVLATGYAEVQPPLPVEFPRLAKPYTQEKLAETLESVVGS
jgi:PAS domain S-box-containing protein